MLISQLVSIPSHKDRFARLLSLLLLLSLRCGVFAMIPFTIRSSTSIAYKSYNNATFLNYSRRFQDFRLIRMSSSTSKYGEFGQLSRTKVHKMKVQELRDALEEMGMDTNGYRKDLLSRLLAIIPEKKQLPKPDKLSSSNSSLHKSVVRAPEDDNMSLPPNNSKNSVFSEILKECDETPGKAILSPQKTYVLQFDGGSRGNPGLSGAGMVLYDEAGDEVWHARHFLGQSSTNNEAEYTALLIGLQCALLMGAQHIVIQGDSELVIKQVKGTYKCKSANLIPYNIAVTKLLNEFQSSEISHIARAQNKRADKLANDAMDWQRSNYMHQFLSQSLLGLN